MKIAVKFQDELCRLAAITEAHVLHD
ncbi:protein YrbN [Klebsiella sp. BIGb0407]|nr:protein YrbN [Klebsiella sp. BIGb0407]